MQGLDLLRAAAMVIGSISPSTPYAPRLLQDRACGGLCARCERAPCWKPQLHIGCYTGACRCHRCWIGVDEPLGRQYDDFDRLEAWVRAGTSQEQAQAEARWRLQNWGEPQDPITCSERCAECRRPYRRIGPVCNWCRGTLCNRACLTAHGRSCPARPQARPANHRSTNVPEQHGY